MSEGLGPLFEDAKAIQNAKDNLAWNSLVEKIKKAKTLLELLKLEEESESLSFEHELPDVLMDKTYRTWQLEPFNERIRELERDVRKLKEQQDRLIALLSNFEITGKVGELIKFR